MPDANDAANTDARLAEAMRCIGTGNPKQAEAICTEILKEQPNNAGALHALGLSHYIVRRYDQAVEFMTRAVQFDDANPQYYCNLAESLRRGSAGWMMPKNWSGNDPEMLTSARRVHPTS